MKIGQVVLEAGKDNIISGRSLLGRRIRRPGFAPHALSWSRGSLSPLGSLAAIGELRRLLRALEPDILHNISLKPVLLATTASLGRGKTAVVNSLTGLGTLFIGEAKVGKTTRRLVRYALSHLLRRKRSKTVVQNPDDRAFVIELGVPEDAVVLIPGSGVDTRLLTPVPEPPPPVTAVYVGRMLADKGILTLVEAFALLGKRGIPLKLLLAGDCDKENPGSLAPEQLREFASLYGIEWLGHVTDIRTAWARSHFAVLASRREGLPKSLLEAAACGRAMVATDAPGCREIAIDGVTALTVPVDDAAALADAMQKLAGDKALRERFATAARALVETKFSAQAIGKETVALYDALRSS